jgi:hypothetical protein
MLCGGLSAARPSCDDDGVLDREQTRDHPGESRVVLGGKITARPAGASVVRRRKVVLVGWSTGATSRGPAGRRDEEAGR